MKQDKPISIDTEEQAGLLDPITEIIDDIRRGRMVILMDDEQRENEGDLLIAAEHARPEDINFMAQYGRGLICLTLTQERCERLDLPLMVRNNDERFTTNFTVSIEAAEGVTTGISAADRATTVRCAVKADAKPSDLVQPGHIFPLMAQPGGVLTRAGHTEAGVDLARMADLEPAAVICEILNPDGSMARLPDLVEFARSHDLKIGTVADLIRYRREHEATVERVAESDFPTGFGNFRLLAYHDAIDNTTHLALVYGQIDADRPTPVRVQVYAGIYSPLAEMRAGVGWSTQAALRRIVQEGAGVLVLIAKQESPADVVRQVRHFQMSDLGIEFPSEEPGDELWTIGVGSQILADIGVGKMRVMGRPRKIHSLGGFGLEVVDYLGNE